jgi:hypothetical protein
MEEGRVWRGPRAKHGKCLWDPEWMVLVVEAPPESKLAISTHE